MTAPHVERLSRRRGAFGLDERRFPDPVRVEADLRAFLAERLPDVWAVPTRLGPLEPAPAGNEAGGRTLALLLPRGRVAVLRIDRDPCQPGPASRALADRCRALHIPHATVSSLSEARAALRRLGVEPRAQAAAPAGPTLDSVFGRG